MIIINKLKRVTLKITDTEKPILIDWLLVGAVILFCYFSFNHGDILCTGSHGRDLLRCIVKGDFLKFYDYTQSTAVYPISIYILFAIWSIPVAFIYRIIGAPMWAALDFTSIPYPVLMWYKLLPTLFYFATAYFIYKIVLQIKFDVSTAKWTAFIFISSPIAMFSQFVFGQYDSIGLFFTVLALYMFIKKKYYSFSVCCSIAITFKLFALFFFVPLLLLFEKRVLHIIKHGIISVSGYIICALPFIRSEGYAKATAFSGSIVPRLFNTGIQTTMGTISLFTVAMILISIAAYTVKVKSDEEYCSYSVYIAFAVFASMFSFILWHPQWVIYMTPFLSLAMLINKKSNSSLLLSCAMSVGYIGTIPLCFPNNVDTCLLGWGAFKNIIGSDLPSMAFIFDFKGILGNNFFYSLFAGAIFVLLILLLPFGKNAADFNDTLAKKHYTMGNRLFILLRPLIIMLFVLPALWLAFR